jgi:peptidoglycan hydrolase-like protein with peptidoglycan-binding domain
MVYAIAAIQPNVITNSNNGNAIIKNSSLIAESSIYLNENYDIIWVPDNYVYQTITVSGHYQSVQRKVAAHYETVEQKVPGYYKETKVWVDDSYKETKAWVAGYYKSTQKWIVGYYKSVQKWIAGYYKNTNKYVPATTKTVYEKVGNKTIAKTVTIAGHYETVKEWVPGHYETVKEWIAGHYETVKEWVPEHYETIVEKIPGYYTTVKEWVPESTQLVKVWIEETTITENVWIDEYSEAVSLLVKGHYEQVEKTNAEIDYDNLLDETIVSYSHSSDVEILSDKFIGLDLRETPYIQKNSCGNYEHNIEVWLKNLGYIGYSDIDNIFGNKDVAAVTKFQYQYSSSHGLNVTGVVDNKTYWHIWAENEKLKYNRYYRLRQITQAQLQDKCKAVDSQIDAPQYQNPDYTKDFYWYNYSKLLEYLYIAAELELALVSLYPGADAMDIGILVYDLRNYKDGDQWKIVSDLAAIGIDGVGFADEIIDGIKQSGKLYSKQINEYLDLALNYPSSNKVILGVSGTYDKIGYKLKYTYFQMDDDIWNELVKRTNSNYDEIWKVNKKFIDNQITAGKEILLSNDPFIKYLFPDGSKRFYQREIDYLKNLGYKFTATNDGLWKAYK